MTNDEYKLKLIQFNATEKYKGEIDFLASLMHIKGSENILDYGCGTGYMVRYIRNVYGCNCYGYDVDDYITEEDEHFFRKEYHFSFDKIYFMHSFAHIEDMDFVFDTLDEWALKSNGYIYIITPNKEWLDLQSKKNYIPDPTVARHYDLSSLSRLVQEYNYKIIMLGQLGDIVNNVCERIFLIAKKQ